MEDNHLNSEEFDWLMEIIMAVTFMIIGIIGVVHMVTTLQEQTAVTTRVDKVHVNSNSIEEDNPFVFTGYQAYMFAWMMDGHDSTELHWFSEEGLSVQDTRIEGAHFSGSGCYVSIDPGTNRSGFIVKRNRAIVGSNEYENYSVKKALSESVDNDSANLCKMYKGTLKDSEGKPILWKLDFSDVHVDVKTPVYDGENIVEERREYIWELHPCQSH